MKSVLVIGLGRFGFHVCQTLNKLGHSVMAVDIKESRVESVMQFVSNAQIGDAKDEDFLKSLGIDNFDLCIVAIGKDFQSSLECTMLLKDLGASFVVSRAADERHEKFLLRNGADKVVYPERELAIWTSVTYSSERVFDYIDLGEDFAMFEVSAPEDWYGKTIEQIDTRGKYQINLLAFRKDGKLTTDINAKTVFSKDETILVLGKNEDVFKCFKLA